MQSHNKRFNNWWRRLFSYFLINFRKFLCAAARLQVDLELFANCLIRWPELKSIRNGIVCALFV